MNNKNAQSKPTAPFAAAIHSAILVCLFCGLASLAGWAQSDSLGRPPVGPGNIVVNTALGGFILGYDIDQTGTEGLLSESLTLANGKNNVAVETFNLKTGKITKIVTEQLATKSDFVTLGIFGSHVGLVEFEHVTNLYVDKRTYSTLNPLSSHKLNGRWTPALTADDILIGESESQGSSTAAMLFLKNTGDTFSSFVFGSDIGANTFGPTIQLTDDVFNWTNSPVMALDESTNQAVIGGSLGCFGCPTKIGLANLTTGAVSEFFGLGLGFVNGIAVDSGTGIAATTTEDDFSVEFYNLATQTGTIVVLPGATSQAQRGGAVAVDPIHKLFLVGQTISSTASSGSSIQVFDETGNLIESLNGFSLPASAVNLALSPANRTGFVYSGESSLQSFSY